jgi:hypothetical protein
MLTALICTTFCAIFQGGSSLVLATFTTAEDITTNARMTLWLLPLAAAIAVIYKVLKLPEIKPVNFIKEVVVLFGSIVVFLVVSALVLFALAWFFV